MKLKPFWALLRTSFLRMLLTSFNIGSGKRKKAASGLGAFIFMAVLMLFISGVYSFSLAAGLAPLGGLDIVVAGIAFMALLLPFVFTVFSAQSMVFSPIDMDLSFSLPVSSFSIMLSRVLALYLEVFLITEMLLLPAAVAYVVFGGTMLALPGIILGGVFWSLIPTGLGLIFGCLVSLLISRLKYKNLFTTIFSILLVGGIFIGSSAIATVDATGGDMETMMDVGLVRQVLYSAFPPVRWLVQGATGSPLLYLLLAAVCILPFFLMVWGFSRFYKKLLTRLSSHRLNKNFKLREVQASSRYGALYKKEARRLFGSNAYLLNSCMGVLMMMVASGWLIFQGGTLMAYMAEIGVPTDMAAQYMPAIITGVCVLLGVMCVPSAASISLEGKYLWVLKAAPVDTMQIFLAKAGLNFTVAGAGVLVCTIALGIAFGPSLPLLLAGLVVSLLYAVFISLGGVYLNLLLPRLDWVNEITVIKQSASPLLAMLGNFVLAALLAGLYFFMLALGAGFPLFCLAAALVLLGLDLALYNLLRTKGRRIFNTL